MTTKIGAVVNKITTIANTIIDIDYPDKCEIKRPSTTIGDYGTGAPSYSTVTGMSDVGCSWEGLSETSAQEYINAGKVSEVCTYKLTIPSAIGTTAINLKPQDRIVVAARGVEPQRTFEVKGIVRGVPLLVLCTLEE